MAEVVRRVRRGVPTATAAQRIQPAGRPARRYATRNTTTTRAQAETDRHSRPHPRDDIRLYRLTQGTLQTVERLGQAELAPHYGDHVLQT